MWPALGRAGQGLNQIASINVTLQSGRESQQHSDRAGPRLGWAFGDGTEYVMDWDRMGQDETGCHAMDWDGPHNISDMAAN